MRLTTQVEGLNTALRKLAALGGKIKNRSLRKCVTAASKPNKEAAKAAAPRKSGALARSQTTKIFSRRGRVVAVTGAKNITYAKGQQPWRYSHLVHDGHKTRGVKGISKMNPYLRRAGRSLNQSERIFTTMMAAEIIAAARS